VNCVEPEGLHSARPNATYLIADQTIAGCYPKLRNNILELIEKQDKTRVCEARPGLTGAVVAPMATGQLL
jgi:hypothetical protein